MKSIGRPFANAARNLRQIGNSPGCWALVAMILGVQVAVTLAGGAEHQPAWSWFKIFGLNREGFFSGRLWQILTYSLFHGSWWHMVLNALFILLIGSRIEHMAGRVVMLRTAGWGVLGGGAGHLLLAPGGAGSPLLVGLSGACLALLLMLTTLSPQSRMMPLPISGKSLGLGIILAALLLALAHPALELPGFAQVGRWLTRKGMESWFQMGHACHFGGALAGWVYGRWLLRPRITLKRLRADRLRREAND